MLPEWVSGGMKLPYILAVRQPIFVICSKYWGLRVKKDHKLQRAKTRTSSRLSTSIKQYADYQVAFLDETGWDTFYHCPYAYSQKGLPVKAQISGKRCLNEYCCLN